MSIEQDFKLFSGNSFSELFANDIQDGKYGYYVSYPSTAGWSHFPNNQKYLIQDGNSEESKVPYNKTAQMEPWRVLSVMGDDIPAILMEKPSDPLLTYWREHFGFKYDNLDVYPHQNIFNELNESDKYDKILSLFPFDHLKKEKHAIDPDEHYRLLSKVTLAEMGVHYPKFTHYDLTQVDISQVKVPDEYPFLVKVSHGLAGEGTYIIRNQEDLDFCSIDIRQYIKAGLVRTVLVSEFVLNEVGNYCVQFYVDREGKATLLGATNQMVTEDGEMIGGVIRYSDTMEKFQHKIAVLSRFLHKHGYFGVVGVDVLENAEGEMFVIDANIRINGSTPLCVLRRNLQQEKKEYAKFSTGYSVDCSLDEAMVRLHRDLEHKDFVIVSANEYIEDKKLKTHIYGIIAGETLDQMFAIENRLRMLGVHG
ncbi:ATP-grasp domain-containing protein [Planctobacterium marinum]